MAGTDTHLDVPEEPTPPQKSDAGLQSVGVHHAVVAVFDVRMILIARLQ